MQSRALRPQGRIVLHNWSLELEKHIALQDQQLVPPIGTDMSSKRNKIFLVTGISKSEHLTEVDISSCFEDKVLNRSF